MSNVTKKTTRSRVTQQTNKSPGQVHVHPDIASVKIAFSVPYTALGKEE